MAFGRAPGASTAIASLGNTTSCASLRASRSLCLRLEELFFSFLAFLLSLGRGEALSTTGACGGNLDLSFACIMSKRNMCKLGTSIKRTEHTTSLHAMALCIDVNTPPAWRQPVPGL